MDARILTQPFPSQSPFYALPSTFVFHLRFALPSTFVFYHCLAVDVGVAQQKRGGRFQQLSFNDDGSIALAPRLAAIARADGEEDEDGGGDPMVDLEAANAAFVPSPELANIDKLATCVIRDAERLDTWRSPARELDMEESPVPWMTGPVRLAIQAAVTPIIPGAAPFRAELEVRFLRALNFCNVLADFSVRGGEPTPELVAQLVQGGM